MSTAQNNILITWSTAKNADGSFTGTCYAFFKLSEAVDGRYASKHVMLFAATCGTRARAKNRAVEAMRYYSHSSNSAALLEKMQAQFPAVHVSDNSTQPA